MTNQRGLTEGVRFQFHDSLGTPRECVEFVAWAGVLNVYHASDFYGDGPAQRNSRG
ncbi:unnamed protein product [Gemmata massiliana]|uniref:Uncharacterized protein n=1 Tax=Gemmata massiliana TaxID=1210884 RepID=A0A6P2CVV1_9BACT|nr:hypothetical protein [Gemmata massiliana]VTR92526.1 unnamed protein product [Gemmata massiliana]